VGPPVLCALTAGDCTDSGRSGAADTPQRLPGLLVALTAAGQLEVIALFSLSIVALVGWMRRLSGATT
jgi:hypothetical protein